MTIALPNDFTLGRSKWDTRESARSMLGDDWRVTVYYKGKPAFELAKQLQIDQWAPVYAGRLHNNKLSRDHPPWQQFTDLHEAVRVMTGKHRILGGVT